MKGLTSPLSDQLPFIARNNDGRPIDDTDDGELFRRLNDDDDDVRAADASDALTDYRLQSVARQSRRSTTAARGRRTSA